MRAPIRIHGNHLRVLAARIGRPEGVEDCAGSHVSSGCESDWDYCEGAGDAGTVDNVGVEDD